VLLGREGRPRHRQRERELAVAVEAPDVTVADVLAAAQLPVVEVVHVDGRRVPTDHTIAEAAIPDGATIALHGAPQPPAVLATTARRAPPRLAVVAGAGAGDAVALDRPVVVGRDPGCDLVLPSDTVSHEHCRVVLDGRGGATVSDLGTTNGTWVGGEQASRRGTSARVGEVLRVGAVVLRIEPSVEDDRPRGLDPLRHLGTAGAVPFNRPPRPGTPPPVPPVGLPDEAPAAREAPTFNLAAVLAPIVLGAVMVVALGSWRYAAFMALSPVLLLANTVSGRRRATRESRSAQAAHREDLERFERELSAAAAAERDRRWELLPSVAEVRRRVELPSTRLWERRTGHADVLRLHAGVGAVPWDPPIAGDSHAARPTGEALVALDRWARLPRSPVAVDLAEGGVVGIVGARPAATALARSLLLQACVHHGPADLPVAVVVDDDRVGDWDWTTWLPHAAAAGGGRRLAAGQQDGAALLADLRARGNGADGTDRTNGTNGADHTGGGEASALPTLVVVLDAPAHLRGRDADARAVLRGAAGPVAGIVLADSADQLPAVCDTIIELRGSDGEARLVRPAERLAVDDLLVAGLGTHSCRRLARRLAGLEDPEVADAVADLPTRADLVDLLPGDPTDAEEVTSAWSRTAGQPALAAPIGVGPDGPVHLDLVADGPHGLLGGTTGSGKSELLRSLVAGVAATHDPDHLTFVLVDYKGGAAFDACADLPHVVGLVTDLDEHLGERALRCLEAELAHREQRLRASGASDLPAWLRLPAGDRGEPLPRLLVVIDEFATLKAELPDFVDALVGIAQRGRSLGVHLVLGTQRPSGAVDENVRANANLRIALRMTDDRDSQDVIGVPDAALILPSLPGRGLLRTGPRDPVPLQTALVTGRAGRTGPAVRVGPVRFGPDDLPPAAASDDPDGPSDLEQLVTACRDAFTAGGFNAPRQPWPDPLPDAYDLEALHEAARETPLEDAEVPLGLLDDPDGQRQLPTGWQPRRGNLLVYGMVGSGTTTTLATVAVSAAMGASPDDLHVHVLDLGRGELAPLAGLPHCGAVVTAREPERRQRLQAWLLAEGERRRQLSHEQLAGEPRQLVVVDGLGTWLDELDDPATYDEYEAVQRLVVDAPGLRMAFVGSVARHGALRTGIAAAVEQRLVHRLADPNDLAALGLRPGDVPPLPPGRAVRTTDGMLLQVARSPDLTAAVAAVAAAAAPPTRPPAPVASLPDRLGWGEVADRLDTSGRRWTLPIGVDTATLGPVGWALHPGEHALVLGPPASGRTGLLAGLAAMAAGTLEVVVVGDAAAGASGTRQVAPEELGDELDSLAAAGRPALVLVDDAEHVPDPGPALDALAASGAPVRLVAAARQDVVQGDYGHWLRRVARSRVGAFLQPAGDVPADLLGARLPRRPPVAVRPGRGWSVAAGAATFVQVLTPTR
jgi:DNA segregation ATPase FtsK/SpoIIIE, S-DNA-T family